MLFGEILVKCLRPVYFETKSSNSEEMINELFNLDGAMNGTTFVL